MDKPKP